MNDAWHEMVMSVPRTVVQHQKWDRMDFQDFVSLDWKKKFLKLLCILKSHYVKKISTSYSAETTVNLGS